MSTESKEILESLRLFLITAPANWVSGVRIKSFALPTQGEAVSCVLWGDLFYITGTDIVRALLYRFECFGRKVVAVKKFEEGVFSDLRSLKPGVDATLEEPRSEFLKFLHENGTVRTQKKQKVFFWFSVDHDKLFLDALDRDLRREKMGQQPCTVSMQPLDLDLSYELAKRHVAEMPFTHSNAAKVANEGDNFGNHSAEFATVASSDSLGAYGSNISRKRSMSNQNVDGLPEHRNNRQRRAINSRHQSASSSISSSLPMNMNTGVDMSMYAPVSMHMNALGMDMGYIPSSVHPLVSTAGTSMQPAFDSTLGNNPFNPNSIISSSSTTTSVSGMQNTIYANSPAYMVGYADQISSEISAPSPRFSEASSMVSDMQMMQQGMFGDGSQSHLASLFTDTSGRSIPSPNQQQNITSMPNKSEDVFSSTISVAPGVAPQQQRQHVGDNWQTNRNSNETGSTNGGQEDLPLACPVPMCGKHFLRTDQLRKHLRSHQSGSNGSGAGSNAENHTLHHNTASPLVQLLHNRHRSANTTNKPVTTAATTMGLHAIVRTDSQASINDAVASDTENIVLSSEAPLTFVDQAVAAAAAAAAAAVGIKPSPHRLDTPPPAPMPSMLPPPSLGRSSPSPIPMQPSASNDSVEAAAAAAAAAAIASNNGLQSSTMSHMLLSTTMPSRLLSSHSFSIDGSSTQAATNSLQSNNHADASNNNHPLITTTVADMDNDRSRSFATTKAEMIASSDATIPTTQAGKHSGLLPPPKSLLHPITPSSDIVLGHHVPPTPTTLFTRSMMQNQNKVSVNGSMSSSIYGFGQNETLPPHPFESEVSSSSASVSEDPGLYSQPSQFLVS